MYLCHFEMVQKIGVKTRIVHSYTVLLYMIFSAVHIVDLIPYVPVNNFSVMSGRVFLHGLNQYKAGINVSCSRT